MPKTGRQTRVKPTATWRGYLLVYAVPLLVMTGLLFWFVATSRVNRSALGPFDLTARIVLYPITRLLDWPWVGVHLIAIGFYRVLPRLWSGLVSALAIVSWYYMALLQAIGLFD